MPNEIRRRLGLSGGEEVDYLIFARSCDQGEAIDAEEFYYLYQKNKCWFCIKRPFSTKTVDGQKDNEN